MSETPAQPHRVCAKCGTGIEAGSHSCPGCGLGVISTRARQGFYAACISLPAVSLPDPGEGAAAAGSRPSAAGNVTPEAASLPVPDASSRWRSWKRHMAAAGVVCGSLLLVGGGLSLPLFAMRLIAGRAPTFLIGFMDALIYAGVPLLLGLALLALGLGNLHCESSLFGIPSLEQMLKAHFVARSLGVFLGSVFMILGFLVCLRTLLPLGSGVSLAREALAVTSGLGFLCLGFNLARRCLEN